MLVVDNRHCVLAHHAGAARVIAGAAVAPRVVEQLVVALDLGAGQAPSRANCFSADAANIRRAKRRPPTMAPAAGAGR
jgi:hypothetical protein